MSRKRSQEKRAESRKNDVDIRAVNTMKVRGVTFGVFVVNDRLAYTGRMGDNGRAFKAAIPSEVAKKLGISVGELKGEGVARFKGWVYSGRKNPETGHFYPAAVSVKTAERFGLL